METEAISARDNTENLDDDENQQNEQQGYSEKRRKLRVKGNKLSQSQFYIKFLIGAAILQAYFVMNYVL